MKRVKALVATILTLGMFCASLIPGATNADTVALYPQGVYAQIDTRLINETMYVFARGTEEERRKVIETIRASPERYAPPVFYFLSNVLFQEGNKDEGAFWFYAGQLRARFDANRCADSTARGAVAELNMEYGSMINQYTLQDIPKLEELIRNVVEWDSKTAHSYDHRWINLNGMGAYSSGLGAQRPDTTQITLSLPEEQWDSIAKKTRDDYLIGFQEAVAKTKKKE